MLLGKAQHPVQNCTRICNTVIMYKMYNLELYSLLLTLTWGKVPDFDCVV